MQLTLFLPSCRDLFFSFSFSVAYERHFWHSFDQLWLWIWLWSGSSPGSGSGSCPPAVACPAMRTMSWHSSCCYHPRCRDLCWDPEPSSKMITFRFKSFRKSIFLAGSWIWDAGPSSKMISFQFKSNKKTIFLAGSWIWGPGPSSKIMIF